MNTLTLRAAFSTLFALAGPVVILYFALTDSENSKILVGACLGLATSLWIKSAVDDWKEALK